MRIKKYHNKKNIAGELIKTTQREKGITKVEICKQLELKGIYINRDELLKMEKNELMIKHFELVALFQILDIDLNILKNYVDN